jgi:hypothetical protein
MNNLQPLESTPRRLPRLDALAHRAEILAAFLADAGLRGEARAALNPAAELRRR